MLEYERSHQGRIELGEFSHVADRISLPEVKAWAAQLLAEREEFWAEHGKRPSGVVEMSDERRKQQDEYYGGQATSNGAVNGNANGSS
jgi:putative hydrolases of HD superfamily